MTRLPSFITERKMPPGGRLGGYEGKDNKINYLSSYLANLTFYFGIYKCILRVIFDYAGLPLNQGS